MPPSDGTLITSVVAGSVDVMTTPTTTIPPVPARWGGQVNYQDMQEMTGGRVKARSFSAYQARDKAARAAGEDSVLLMPLPVEFTPNPWRSSLPPVAWFDGPAIWTWLGNTGKLPPQPDEDP